MNVTDILWHEIPADHLWTGRRVSELITEEVLPQERRVWEEKRKKERNRLKTSINNYSLNILYYHNVFLGCVKLMQLRFLSFKVFPIPSDYNPYIRPDNPVLIWRLELMERRDGSCLTVSCSWSRRPPPRCSHRSMICLILRENK